MQQDQSKTEGVVPISSNAVLDGWIKTSNALPDTSFSVSKPLFFIADKKIFAGHYHSNGWFYCEVENLEIRMARGRISAVPAGGDAPYYDVTHWQYMRKPSNAADEQRGEKQKGKL